MVLCVIYQVEGYERRSLVQTEGKHAYSCHIQNAKEQLRVIFPGKEVTFVKFQDWTGDIIELSAPVRVQD